MGTAPVFPLQEARVSLLLALNQVGVSATASRQLRGVGTNNDQASIISPLLSGCCHRGVYFFDYLPP